MKAAKVTLVSKSHRAERSTVTNDDGQFTFVNLTPSTYTVSVDGGASFNPYTAEEVVVRVGDKTLNIRLDVRGVSQT